jgi:hypothetical protein
VTEMQQLVEDAVGGRLRDLETRLATAEAKVAAWGKWLAERGRTPPDGRGPQWPPGVVDAGDGDGGVTVTTKVWGDCGWVTLVTPSFLMSPAEIAANGVTVTTGPVTTEGCAAYEEFGGSD